MSSSDDSYEMETFTIPPSSRSKEFTAAYLEWDEKYYGKRATRMSDEDSDDDWNEPNDVMDMVVCEDWDALNELLDSTPLSSPELENKIYELDNKGRIVFQRFDDGMFFEGEDCAICALRLCFRYPRGYYFNIHDELLIMWDDRPNRSVVHGYQTFVPNWNGFTYYQLVKRYFPWVWEENEKL